MRRGWARNQKRRRWLSRYRNEMRARERETDRGRSKQKVRRRLPPRQFAVSLELCDIKRMAVLEKQDLYADSSRSIKSFKLSLLSGSLQLNSATFLLSFHLFSRLCVRACAWRTCRLALLAPVPEFSLQCRRFCILLEGRSHYIAFLYGEGGKKCLPSHGKSYL